MNFRGSAIARIVGATTKAFPNEFDPTVRMWVFEEIVNGEKLSEVINTRHENVKYLPGKILPENIVSGLCGHTAYRVSLLKVLWR